MINEWRVRKLVVGYFFLFFAGYGAFSQNLTDLHWRFGNSPQAIDFDKGNFRQYITNEQATPFGTGGGVTISDPLTGNLLFYSDGSVVYDASNAVAPGGTGLNGNNSINQAAVASPVPGNPEQFYIFTNSGSGGVNEIQYSIADKSLMGNAAATGHPLGEVIQLNTATGLANPAEAMAMIPGPDLQRYWLLSQNTASGDYRVTDVSTFTTTTFNFSSATNPAFEAAAFGVYTFRPDSIIIAVAPKTANRNIQILLFDATTGTLQFDRQMTNTGVNDGAGESIFDVEWSYDGTKLYYSRHGGDNTLSGQVYQYDFDSLQTTTLVAGAFYRSYGLQRGPDRRLYYIYQAVNSGPFLVGRFNQPDSLPDSVAYEPQIAEIADIQGRQFPATSPPSAVTFSMSFNIFGLCQGNPTLFSPAVEPTPQFLLWDFGDGAAAFSYAPVYTYPDPGTYSVTLTAILNGQSQSITQIVNIIENQLQLNLNDTTVCPDEFPFEMDATPEGQQGGSFEYLWSTGETTAIVDIDSAGTYWAQVTDLNTGCPAYASFVVTEYGSEESSANVWYFGQQAGIDFNEQPAIPITDENLMDSPEGCAAMSDINGDLLFYTNGRTVWNKNHAVMLNGTLIGGDSTAAQSALIVPIPDNETLFYIFTTDEVYGDRTYNMRFSIVDMKQDQARGAVVVKNRPLFTNSTEKLAATGVGGGTIQVFGHEFGNNNYRNYPVTNQGIGNSIVSSVGRVLSFAEELNGRGTMKVSPTGNTVGSVIPGAQNYFELVSLDSTGSLSFPVLVDLLEPAPAEAYGIEFSSSGDRLYVSLTGAGSKLLQYKLDSLTNPTGTYDEDSTASLIAASKFELATGSGFGTIQTGPDQVIYMAKDGSGNLATVTNPNGDDGSAGYNDQGFDLAGRTSTLGLPNFVQNFLNPPQDPSIAVDGDCLGQLTRFSATGTSDIDEFLWNFGEGGNQAIAQDTSYTYLTPGPKIVTLRITNRCGLDTTLVQNIMINPSPEAPQTPGAAAICSDDGVVLTAWPQDDPGLTYTWSTGETTREITVTQPSTITVFITNASGCRSDTVTTLVGDQRPVVDLGPDQTICQGEELGQLDAQNPGSTYSWAINGAATGNTTRFQDVDTSQPGDYEYAVSIVDVNGCSSTSTITYTILEEPVATVQGINASNCGVADGSLDINVTSSGSFSYRVDFPDPSDPAIIRSADGPFTDNIPGLEPGTYRLTLTNVVTGCSNIFGAVGVDSDVASFTFTATPVNGCETGEIDYLANTAGTYNLRVIDADTGAEVFAGPTTETGTATGIPFGTYTVEMRSADGCIQTQENVVVEQDPVAEFTFDPIQTGCAGEAVVEVRQTDTSLTDVTYEWIDPSNTTLAETTASITATVGGTYTVRSVSPTLCSQTEQIEVIISDTPDGTIEVSGDPCLGVLTLTAVPTVADDYIFGWSNGATTTATDVTASGTYTVTIRNRATGCLVNIDTAVQVENELEVVLIQEPDCDNQDQVILTAQANVPAQVHFEWIGPDGTVLPDTTSTISTGLGGMYTANVRGINNSCEATADLNVNVIPILDSEVTLPEALTFCSEDPANSTVTLTPGIFNTYEWRRLPDTNIISTSSQLQVNEAGTYEVTFSNGSVCRTARVRVTDDCRPKIYAPNAFSPDGRGLPENENFYVYPNPYVTDFVIFIYNRWGELVYQSNSIDFQWNGTFNGTPLPVATYAYIMRYKSNLDATEEVFEQHGTVTLIK